MQVKFLLITTMLIGLTVRCKGENFIPAKPSVSSNCSGKSTVVNNYISDVQYLKILNQFVHELQILISKYQQELQTFVSKSQYTIEYYRKEIFDTQKHISLLRMQSQQKQAAIAQLRAEIKALLNNERLTFQYLNNAVCLYQGAKTIVIASELEKLASKKIKKDLYLAKSQSLSTIIFDLINVCEDFTSEKQTSSTDLRENIITLEQLNKSYLPPQALTAIKQEEFGKRAANLFAIIQRRLLNAYVLINQNKGSDDPFVNVKVSQDVQADRKTYDNLVNNALDYIDPTTFKDAINGFKTRLNTFITTTKQEWLRAIKLYQFGYQICDCQKQCTQALDQKQCLNDCELRGKQLFSYMQRNCSAECDTLYTSCNKLCTGDIIQTCTRECANTKTNCLNACNTDNKQRNFDWQHCVNVSKTCADPDKSKEICQQFQSLGIADIQNEINVLQKQIAKPAEGEQPSENNIPAKIDAVMKQINRVKTPIENKINQVKSILDQTQQTISSTQETIKTTKIENLLPPDNQAKSTCANNIKALLEASINLQPAMASASRFAQYLDKTYKTS